MNFADLKSRNLTVRRKLDPASFEGKWDQFIGRSGVVEDMPVVWQLLASKRPETQSTITKKGFIITVTCRQVHGFFFFSSDPVRKRLSAAWFQLFGEKMKFIIVKEQ